MSRADKEERMHRIRIGLTGLAVVFLLVLLVTAIGRSGDDAAAPSAQNELASPDEPNEPLAEIGAAPGAGAASNEDDEQSNSTKGP
jgi:hypothetical protein